MATQPEDRRTFELALDAGILDRKRAGRRTTVKVTRNGGAIDTCIVVPDSEPDSVTPKRRGRRPAGDRAMTPAERQKAYRERKKEEVWFASTDESSRVALLAKLAHHLRAVDEEHELKEGAQQLAEEVLAEIITRYGLRAKRVTSLAATAQRVTK